MVPLRYILDKVKLEVSLPPQKYLQFSPDLEDISGTTFGYNIYQFGHYYVHCSIRGNTRDYVEYNPVLGGNIDECQHFFNKLFPFPPLTVSNVPARLDFAIDFTGSIPTLKSKRATSIIRSALGELETLTVGSRASDIYIRLYDKGLESGAVKRNFCKRNELMRLELELKHRYFTPPEICEIIFSNFGFSVDVERVEDVFSNFFQGQYKSL